MGKAAAGARLWGFQVAMVEASTLGEHKDVNAYWVAHRALPWLRGESMPGETPDAFAELPDEPWTDDMVEEAIAFQHEIERDLEGEMGEVLRPWWQPKVLSFRPAPWWERLAAMGVDPGVPAHEIGVPPKPGDIHQEALDLAALWRSLDCPIVHGPFGEQITNLDRWLRLNGPDRWDSVRWSLSVYERQGSWGLKTAAS